MFTGSEGTRLTARKSRLILKCGGAVASGMKAMIAGEDTGEAKVGLRSCKNPIAAVENFARFARSPQPIRRLAGLAEGSFESQLKVGQSWARMNRQKQRLEQKGREACSRAIGSGYAMDPTSLIATRELARNAGAQELEQALRSILSWACRATLRLPSPHASSRPKPSPSHPNQDPAEGRTQLRRQLVRRQRWAVDPSLEVAVTPGNGRRNRNGQGQGRTALRREGQSGERERPEEAEERARREEKELRWMSRFVLDGCGGSRRGSSRPPPGAAFRLSASLTAA